MHYIIYLVLFLYSCAYNDVGFINKPGTEYFPNKIGNYWEYSVIDSTYTDKAPVKYNVAVRVVEKKIMADGKEAFVWKYQFPAGVDPFNSPFLTDSLFVRIENDTVKTFDRWAKTIGDFKFPRQIFPIPFQTGQKWNGKLLWIDTYGVSQGSREYLINYHYVGPNMEHTDQLYFTPNIGFVKMSISHYDMGPIIRQTWQLQKYSLN